MTIPPKENNKFNTRPPIATRSHIAFTNKGQERAQGFSPKQPSPKTPPSQTVTTPPVPQQPATQIPNNYQENPPAAAPQLNPEQNGLTTIPAPQQAPPKRLVGIPINMSNQFAQRTGVTNQAAYSPEAQSLDKAIEAALNETKDQIQYYLEVCDTLSRRPIDLEYLVELLFVLTRALNFDFLVFLKSSGNDYFSHCISRGLKSDPPNFQKIFTKSLSDGRIIWTELMNIISLKDGEIAKWMHKDKIPSIGYVPFQDGNNILGFMIIGSYSKKQKSPIASQILELCGGRIGLAFAYDVATREKKDKVNSILTELESEQAVSAEYIELLSSSFQDRESLAGKLIHKCADSIKKIDTKIAELKTVTGRN